MVKGKYIQRFKELETPFYFYDLELLNKTLQKVKEASEKYGYILHFALKANNNDAILSTIQQYGIGADCVSGNEITKSINLGFPANKIAFAGVGKTDQEIITGLENNIFSFNCESIHEMEVINEIAKSMGKIAPIAIRINPDVDPKTHKFISTGLKESKFGINHWDFDDVANTISKTSNLKLTGIHFHVGSQITDINVFKQLSLKINLIQEWFDKHGFKLEHINVGGGFGIDYQNPEANLIPDFDAYFEAFHKNIQLKEGQELHFELGRSMVAQCGYFITKVLFLKKGLNSDFLIVDGGMNDLLRPMLYQAYHKISSLSRSGENKTYNVVGPVCESTDIFQKDVPLPESKRGDLLAIHSAGAYCEVMASTYNMRNLIKAYDSDSIFEE